MKMETIENVLSTPKSTHFSFQNYRTFKKQNMIFIIRRYDFYQYLSLRK